MNEDVFRALAAGQLVMVRYGDGEKGLMAAEILPFTNTANRHSH